jgi:ketosteroid isomerase-like protein
MRTIAVQALALIAAIGLTACGGATPQQEFSKQDVDQINQMVQGFVAAYNAKDIEKIGTFFAGNAVLMPANQNTLRSVDSIKSWYEFRVKDQGAKDLVIEQPSVEGHGPLAYFAGTFSVVFAPADGTEPRHDRGKVLWIVRKFAGQWKFECQIMSSDLPPAAPPEAKAAPTKK